MKYLIFLLSLILPATLLAQTQWIDATGDTIRVVSKTGTATAAAPGVIGVKDSIVQFTVKVPVMGTVQIPYSYKYDTVVVIKKQTTTQPPVVTDPPPATGSGQMFAFSVTQKTSSQPWLMPFGGAEQWNDQNFAASSVRKLDKYFRFSWSMFESGQGVYTWTKFDQEINDAISKGQKFSFGIMTHYPDAVSPHRLNYDGGYSVYPQYLHNLMQAESVKDWKAYNGSWVPNWNSEAYLSRLLALNQAVNNHINTTSYNGVAYKDVINYIDIRGYGAFGEWHSYTIADQMGQYPAGTRATLATLQRIVDAHVKAYRNFPLVALIAAFDCNTFANTMNPPEIAAYILTQKNDWGLIGYRRDNWGDAATYYDAITLNNTRTVNGVNIGSTIKERWKYAPVVGEPCCSSDNYASLKAQVQRHHAVSIGNGNYSNNSTAQANYLAAVSAAGHKVSISGGSFKDGVITVNWTNIGLTPVYEAFDTWFELRQGDVVKWSGKSSSSITMRLPGTWSTTDTFTGLPAGDYELHVVVKNGQRGYPLGITSSRVAVVKI